MKTKKHRKGGLRNGAGRKAGPKTVTVSFRVLESHAEAIKETVAAKIKELNEGPAASAVPILAPKPPFRPEPPKMDGSAPKQPINSGNAYLESRRKGKQGIK